MFSREHVGLGALAVLSLAVLAIWGGGTARATLLGGGGGLAGHGAVPAALRRDPHTAFDISGSVHGLYPGLTEPLTLVVTNREPFAIVVTSITVVVGNGGPGCSASNVVVAPFAGSLPVAGRRSATATVHLTLVHAAPDACQGATFGLSYHGTAVKR